MAKELGVEFIALHLAWTQIETTPNNYEDPDDALLLLGQVAAANSFQFSLTLRPIDLSGKIVPSDLENMRFNDTTMIRRFESLIDFVFTKVNPSVLLNLQIGNEIDGYNFSQEPASFWSDYGFFLKEINAYIKKSHPDLKAGFTGTLKGLNNNPSLFNQVLSNVDILGVTYYPIQSDYTVELPTVLNGDFDLLLTNYPSKPIYVQELGYQTAARCNSNEQKQAKFFSQFFNYWDKHASDIKSVNLVRLNDLSIQAASDAALQYNLSDSIFFDYLRTIGIRTYSGTGSHKMAFDTLKIKLKERGW
ncbi:MAG: hypothetical protein JKY48_11885 [Flavobacteriales bacterium]|nr:hypothetical protein [Flavobacteriales bacterium]